jgi:RND family efflux transporter MFP subunit
VRLTTRAYALITGLAFCTAGNIAAQDAAPALVQVEQVREQAIERALPLTGRVFSRHDADLSLTLAGELHWVLEPGTQVAKGEVIAQLDQKPILLRRDELQSMVEREKINAAYLEKELKRVHRLRADNNASERLVDESASMRDLSHQDIRSLQARIDQLDDELRRSRLTAPYAGVIAERHKRGGEYAQPGEVIARLVDLDNLELRFEVPVVYLPRIRAGQPLKFNAQGGQVLGSRQSELQATVRAIIPAANINSQTFQVRADLLPPAPEQVIAGQLVNIQVQLSGSISTLQVPRDAIVLRDEGKYVFLIGEDDTARKVMVSVGEGAADWVSVNGELRPGDWVAVRGIERLRDGQAVSRQDS